MRKVLLGVSGGAASAAVAALFKLQGHDVSLCHLDFSGLNEKIRPRSNLKIAEQLASVLDLHLTVVDVTKDAQAYLKAYTENALERGRPPDYRSLMCDELFVSVLEQKRHELNCEVMATGHFVKIVRDSVDQSIDILKSTEPSLDQSERIAFLSNDYIKNLECPLGDFKLQHLKKMVSKFDLPAYESFDRKVVDYQHGSENKFYEYFPELVPDGYLSAGNVLSPARTVIGKHNGIANHLLGENISDLLLSARQPEKLIIGFIPERYAITNVDPALYNVRRILLRSLIWRDHVDLRRPLKLSAHLYGSNEEVEVYLTSLSGNCAEAVAIEGELRVFPGQPLVFYRENHVVASGWSEKCLPEKPLFQHSSQPSRPTV